jgi:hypothetical protein
MLSYCTQVRDVANASDGIGKELPNAEIDLRGKRQRCRDRAAPLHHPICERNPICL